MIYTPGVQSGTVTFLVTVPTQRGVCIGTVTVTDFGKTAANRAFHESMTMTMNIHTGGQRIYRHSMTMFSREGVCINTVIVIARCKGRIFAQNAPFCRRGRPLREIIPPAPLRALTRKKKGENDT